MTALENLFSLLAPQRKRFLDWLYEAKEVKVYSDGDLDGFLSAVILREWALKEEKVKVSFRFGSRKDDRFTGAWEEMLEKGEAVLFLDKHLPESPDRAPAVDHHFFYVRDGTYYETPVRLGFEYRTDVLPYATSALLLPLLYEEPGNIPDSVKVLALFGAIADSSPLRPFDEYWGLLKEEMERRESVLYALRRAKKMRAVTRVADIRFNLTPVLSAMLREGEIRSLWDIFTGKVDPAGARRIFEDAERVRKESSRKTAEFFLVWAKKAPGEMPVLLEVPEDLMAWKGVFSARLSNAFGVPVAVMSKKDGIVRISIRVPEFYSSKGVDLLRRIAPYLIDGGGHERAFGITAKEENLPQIELELSNWRDELISGLDDSIWKEAVEVPSVEFDAVMENLIHLEPMEPGQGFMAFRGVLEDALLVGQEKEHLLLKLKDTPVKFLKLWSTEADLNLAREARGMKIDVMGGHFTDAMARSWSVLSWRRASDKPALVEEEVSPLAVVGCMGSGGGNPEDWVEDLEDEE